VIAHVPEPGSFRDPSGQVYDIDGQIFRTVTEFAARDYEFVREQGLLNRLCKEGWVVETEEVDPAVAGIDGSSVRYLLRHSRIAFISYPYEWPFAALKAAALHQLDFHLRVMEEGATLSDASAYNIQFQGPRPIFIDVLSLRRYREGEFWTGHRQFCEQFLNPLLLRSVLGIPHNAWYRGNLEGITTTELNRLLPLRRKISWNMMTHVLLQARLERGAIDHPQASSDKAQTGRKLTRAAYCGLLTQLRNWIARLEPADTGKTVWGDYAQTHTYSSEDEEAKKQFVAEFMSQTKPRLAWDLGCNVGDYSAVALGAGAEAVIGFDFDQKTLERAYARATSEGLHFLPLFLDAANPSPDQGWNHQERQSLGRRAHADAILALAFEHHLAIGRNVPLNQVVAWLTGLAPRGVIEFVSKADQTVKQMLALREDIFSDYSEEVFTAALESRAKIVKSLRLAQSERSLFWYDRTNTKAH
jgi:ribosomal protein L11 methylase PrmA